MLVWKRIQDGCNRNADGLARVQAQNLNMSSLTDTGTNLTIKLAIPDKASAKRGQADWDAPIRAAGGGAS